jgi:hypothetical protein
MTPLTFHREAAEGPLLIADISGYSSFLQDVAHAHRDDAFADGAIPAAYGLMSSLLDGIVGRIVPPFTLSKLEGDAVFAFGARGNALPRGEALLECIGQCYADFRGRLESAEEVWTCTCAACVRANTLDLKFVVHAGRYVVQEIAGSRELSGPEVVMVHRLLKNGAARLVGHGAYVLLSTAAVRELGVDTSAAIPITETYEHYQPIDGFVFPLR